ncbi:MAG: type IX secretion system membrane protein PorP/SprF [Bacteroidota bacterium]
MKKLTGIAFSLLLGMTVHAQDPQFSQFYANTIYTNPAFTGASGRLRLAMAARNQYTALQRNYKTASVSLDADLNSLNGGLGLIAMTDVAGDGFLTTTSVSGIYAYRTALTRKISFRAALQAGIIQKNYDYSQFRFGDQIDDRLGFVLPTRETRVQDQISFPNFSGGILVFSDRIFGGAAIHNMIEPNQSFFFPNSSDADFRLPRRYTAHLGSIIYLSHQRNESDRTYISPNILYMQQRNFNQLNLGFFYKREVLSGGIWFRQTSNNTDAVIGLISLRFNRFRVGYSYDAVVSNARTATVGTHELTLVLEIKLPRKTESKRQSKMLKCPDM